MTDTLKRILRGKMRNNSHDKYGRGVNLIPIKVDVEYRLNCPPEARKSQIHTFVVQDGWVPGEWFQPFIRALARIYDVEGYKRAYEQHNIRFVDIKHMLPREMEQMFPGLWATIQLNKCEKDQKGEKVKAAQRAKDKAIEDAPALLAAAKAAEAAAEDEHDRMLREQEGRALGGGAGASQDDQDVPDNWDSSSDDEDDDDKGGVGAGLSVIPEDWSGEKDDNDDDKGGAGAAQ